MDFLKSLYSNDNFGMYLFISISILVLAFLIILFFGKKDQKERKLAETNNSINLNNNLNNNLNKNETNQIESPKSEVAFESQAPSEALEIREPMNIFEKPIMEEQPEPIPMMEQMTEPVLPPNLPPRLEEPISMTSEMQEPPKTDFDFDALAASISKELESIGIDTTEKEEEPPLDATITLPPLQVDPIQTTQEKEQIVEPVNPIVFETPIVETPPVEMKLEEESPRFTEEKITKPSKTQFSSVFVNKKSEIPAEVTNVRVEEEQENTLTSTPVKPSMELPKTIDLPKLNTDPEPKAQVLDDDIPHIVFPSLENDIPKYSENNNENRM